MHASIKALQLLGNSIQGINFAQWQLAYNAICLPVLTYGCQLWFTGKQKGLVKKLQVVQNEAIRIISGTFCTTPQELLHQMLNILPIDLHLRMITDNATLHLYRLQDSSQVLTWLGGDWQLAGTVTPMPLPTPTCSRAKTTLQALAKQANLNGLCIRLMPNIPLYTPH